MNGRIMAMNITESSRTTKPGRAPVPVAWLEIDPDGTETERTGCIWSSAAPVAGMAAFWVMPDVMDQGVISEPADGHTEPVVLVVRSSRRHRGGRAVTRDGILGPVAVWLEAGGRWIDKGEWFRETDPRSRCNRTYAPPTHAPVRRMDVVGETAMTLFRTLCENGADDYSVSVSDVAAANDATLTLGSD